MVFELDSLISGDFSAEMFVGNQTREGMYVTARAMSRFWKIPEPQQLFRYRCPMRVIDIYVEARRAVEVLHARRRAYLCGVSRELDAANEACAMLGSAHYDLERRIAIELGISGQRISDSDVVRHGGFSAELLHQVLIEWF